MTLLDRLRTRAARGDDEGFSLLEVLVSFVLFAVVAAAATTGIVNAINTAHAGQSRTDAANVAAGELANAIAAYRQSGTVPLQTSTRQVAVGTDTITVVRSGAFVGSATACTAGASFRIHVDASQGSTMLAQTDAVVAC